MTSDHAQEKMAPRSSATAGQRVEDDADRLVATVKEITGRLLGVMGIPGEVICRDRRGDDTPHLWVEIVSQESGLLIGDRGSTLAAFEHVLRLILRPVLGEDVRVVADVNAYRVRRMDLMRRLTRDAVQRVRRTGRAVVLEPMRAADRRIVHLTATEEEGIASESVGEEPMRRVVVRPKDPLA